MVYAAVTYRRWLYAAGLTVVAALLGSFSGKSIAAEQPLMTFVQWNDVHLDSTTPSDYRLANAKMDYLVRSLNAETCFPLPNFVIGVGDMITGEGAGVPKLTADFALLKAKLARLKCPFYPVMGNHEDIQREGNGQYEAPYRAAFGDDRVNYTFQRGGIQFLMLNDSGAPATNQTEVGKARDQWLRHQLDASPSVPKIICCHIPLVPLREESVLQQSFGFASYAARDDHLVQMVEQHSDTVIAVLSGHLHLTGVTQRNGIYHISVSGTASYPCDFAYYAVFSDRIRVRIYSLPKELVTPDTDIHGRPRWATDYTDATHSTHRTYVAGNASERAFDIPLRHKR
jgi:hypothetical protein